MLSRYGSFKRQNGQITLLATFLAVPMIGLLGLVTDVGYMYYVKKEAQAAADSAVLAAVSRFHNDVAGSVYTCTMTGVPCKSSYACPTSPTTADAAQVACLYAQTNGFTNSGNQSVIVDSNVGGTGGTAPPTVPGLNSAAFWITVRVSQHVPQLFAAVTGNSSGLVAARATGAVTPAKDCIYVLDPTAIGAYYQNGNTTVTSACGVYVNSNNATQAMYNSGNSNLTATEYDIVGGYQWHGTLTPTPTTGSPTTGDPLKSLAVPSTCSSSGGCAAAGCSASSNTTQVNGSTDLYSGIYCGGIFVKSGTATLHPGTYILVGGGIGTQDTNSIVKGSGVFFYNTYDAHHGYSPIAFNANSDVELSAATSGTYAAILFMQDRSCCSSSMPIESFQGGPTTKFEGTIYFPYSQVDFAGNPTMSMANYTLLVVKQLRVLGTSTINNNYSALSGGIPIQQLGLVE